MMKTMGFPGRYIQGKGALSSLGSCLNEMGYRRPLCITDAVVGRLVWPAVAADLEKDGIAVMHIEFPGECTRAAIAQLCEQAGQHRPDVIVALGGGKTVDAGKGVARELDLSIIVCPTVASNDAPTSRLIVLYDEHHAVAGVDYMKRNPDTVLVDTGIIVQAPARFFAAGIGDAISKKFEAEQCFKSGGNNTYGTPPLNTALLMARHTYEVIEREGVAAYQAACEHRVTQEVENVVEATVLLSGIGFESGGLSLAHALIRGLTAIPAMADKLHGELVAFGTIVQMIADGRPEAEVLSLVSLLKAVDLPVCLAGLGQMQPLTTDEYARITAATLATNYSRNMVPPLTASSLMHSLREADRLGRSYR